MSIVGILPHPASGKDIRRLVAYGAAVDNVEKVAIVRRVLAGLAATGVQQVLLMPEWFGIGGRALDGLRLPLAATLLEMPLTFTQEDTTVATRLMVERGARCLVTVGGDGTNRAVAKACGDVPRVALSTGTNNVFPTWVDGTLTGVASGLVACGCVDTTACVRRARRLEVEEDGHLRDIALLDVAVCDTARSSAPAPSGTPLWCARWSWRTSDRASWASPPCRGPSGTPSAPEDRGRGSGWALPRGGSSSRSSRGWSGGWRSPPPGGWRWARTSPSRPAEASSRWTGSARSSSLPRCT